MKACVDIGGTKVSVSLVAASTSWLPSASEFLARQAEPTATTGTPDALVRQVVRLVASACAEVGTTPDALHAVGVASCGPFVMREGLIELRAPNICGGVAGPARGLPNDWTAAPLEAPLRAVWGDRLRLENDGIAALQAERRWGALLGLDHCGYLTWSTGIGFGLCVGGHVLRGKNGNAGHAGHMLVSDDNDPLALCGCGNLGDVEGLVAGNAIARRFAPQGFADAAVLLAAAQAGDAQALALVDELCRVMGRTLYNLAVTLDLQRISVGGSVFWHHQRLLLPRLRAQITGRLAALTDGFELVPAGLGERVGDFAALALVS
jgi:glucokinase